MRVARSVTEALAASPAAALLTRVLDAQRVAKAVASSHAPLPPAFDPLAPGACELRGQILWLVVASPAVAAKLRQCLPQLRDALNRQGFDLTEIKVRLQPARKSYPADAPPVTHIADLRESEAGEVRRLTAALSLAEKLALTYPGAALGEAASRLAARLRDRLARIR
ncbi:MAG: flagellar hook-length control protein FliK [Burkholderiaceae bacterium]|nr:flagellar hook-length control protein FliK [Burkholderiaceae bacterium]